MTVLSVFSIILSYGGWHAVFVLELTFWFKSFNDPNITQLPDGSVRIYPLLNPFQKRVTQRHISPLICLSLSPVRSQHSFHRQHHACHLSVVTLCKCFV